MYVFVGFRKRRGAADSDQSYGIILVLETFTLTFMANLRHFVCDKNKIIDRKTFYLYNLLKRPKTPHKILCLTTESYWLIFIDFSAHMT